MYPIMVELGDLLILTVEVYIHVHTYYMEISTVRFGYSLTVNIGESSLGIPLWQNSNTAGLGQNGQRNFKTKTLFIEEHPR